MVTVMPALHATPDANRPHVLVVDDDVEICSLISRYLGANGYRVSTAGDGAQLQAAMREHQLDLILLDLGLPDEDGLSLLRRFQNEWRCPVIVVSGRGESVERIVGLELGADDYISKPFDLRELLARVRSVLRRLARGRTGQAASDSDKLEFSGLQFDVLARRLVGRDGQDIVLTSGEFELLRALVERPNQVHTRDQLMNCLHGRDAGPFDRAVDVQVGRLRRKIEIDAGSPQLIKSVRSAGYLFAAPVRKL
jgi:two-component system OmpR family response regulator